ncbi:uncharacterized protein LOC131153500 [Malania oleifera]|uniref:uncharacterized protein LOC131153500 n=1 Tax=Malania oleifera TaxID=397392 RepID=UPI0025ADE642|nr:uncharacterized protein LOC131153500 [Malania oleifera]
MAPVAATFHILRPPHQFRQPLTARTHPASLSPSFAHSLTAADWCILSFKRVFLSIMACIWAQKLETSVLNCAFFISIICIRRAISCSSYSASRRCCSISARAAAPIDDDVVGAMYPLQRPFTQPPLVAQAPGK